MVFPENISSLTVEEIRDYIVKADERIVELLEQRKATTATVAELVANKKELDEVKGKRADFELALTVAGEIASDDADVTGDAGEGDATQDDVTQDETTSDESTQDETTQDGSTQDDETVVKDDGQVSDTTQDDIVPPTAETSNDESDGQRKIVDPQGSSEENTGENIVADNINQASDSAKELAYVTASFRGVTEGATNDVEAVQRVSVKSTGGDAFKVRYETDNVINNSTMNVNSWTEKIMSLGTPGREGELSFAQKQFSKSRYGKVDASFCAPAERIDADIQCGSYVRTLGEAFPSAYMDGLEVEWMLPMDSSDPDFVGEVDLDASEINKSCYEAPCVTRAQARAAEIKACLTGNEQTVFTNPAGIEALLRDGEALLPAVADQILLERIINGTPARDGITGVKPTYKFSYDGAGLGFAAFDIAAAIAREQLERQSMIHQVGGLVPIVPRSIFNYKAADNSVRQFSLLDAQSAAEELFAGQGFGAPIIIDDAIDITNDDPVPALSTSVALDLATVQRTDWSIHLVDPADGFRLIRNENDFRLEPVPQSHAQKVTNSMSWFARQYELFGRRGCSPWATIDVSNVCLGGRVIASAACVGS